jgi:hypothetical protein
MIESNKQYKELFEDAIHLSSQIVDEHFGKIEDIRKENQDREEVEFKKNLKMLTYEIILKKLLRDKLSARIHKG